MCGRRSKQFENKRAFLINNVHMITLALSGQNALVWSHPRFEALVFKTNPCFCVVCFTLLSFCLTKVWLYDIFVTFNQKFIGQCLVFFMLVHLDAENCSFLVYGKMHFLIFIYFSFF